MLHPKRAIGRATFRSWFPMTTGRRGGIGVVTRRQRQLAPSWHVVMGAPHTRTHAPKFSPPVQCNHRTRRPMRQAPSPNVRSLTSGNEAQAFPASTVGALHPLVDVAWLLSCHTTKGTVRSYQLAQLETLNLASSNYTRRIFAHHQKNLSQLSPIKCVFEQRYL